MFLVVDDCESMRDLLRLQLGQERTRTAATILDGLREAQQTQPPFILLDNYFDVDEVTGIDAVPAFRQVAPDAVIIILTADRDRSDVIRAKHAGADYYVCKDAELADLWRAVWSAMDIDPVPVTRTGAEGAFLAKRGARRYH